MATFMGRPGVTGPLGAPARFEEDFCDGAPILEAVDDGGGELRALDLGGALHEPGEVVGDDIVGDGGLQGPHDVVGGLGPPEVLEHRRPRGAPNRG